jgi:AraC family transcriptional regulator of adaptative response/methylated-DNA-[protein]-cysteine methyltransferase
LQAGFRACLRCRPLEPPNAESAAIRRLLDAVESEPTRRWRDADLRAFGLHPSTVRRHFRRRFGKTFLEYAREWRLGTAADGIRGGGRVIDAQQDAGYESASGFRDAFARTFGANPGRRSARTVGVHWFDSPLGPIVVAGDEQSVCCVEYADREGLDRQIARLAARSGACPIPGRSAPVARIETELGNYFAGRAASFTAPLARGGTPFQNAVWDALLAIPLGETQSYADVARAIGKPDAVRAVAQANGANPLAIVIPCHRVINAGGGPGGYGGGLPRKLWLLEHERRMLAGVARIA